MAGRIFVGTSGYVYPHWRTRFYPRRLPQREWLAFYAAHFTSVEMNNPFYRLPRAETFAAWPQAPAARARRPRGAGGPPRLLARPGGARAAPGGRSRALPRRLAPLTADFVYVRRHGTREGYGGAYGERALRTDARAVRRWRRQGRDVYVYFNNDPNAFAVLNARRLAELVGRNQRRRP